MMDPKTSAKAGQATAVADVRAIPLDRLSEHADRALRRVVPRADTPTVPVTQFDAAL